MSFHDDHPAHDITVQLFLAVGDAVWHWRKVRPCWTVCERRRETEAMPLLTLSSSERSVVTDRLDGSTAHRTSPPTKPADTTLYSSCTYNNVHHRYVIQQAWTGIPLVEVSCEDHSIQSYPTTIHFEAIKLCRCPQCAAATLLRDSNAANSTLHGTNLALFT